MMISMGMDIHSNTITKLNKETNKNNLGVICKFNAEVHFSFSQRYYFNLEYTGPAKLWPIRLSLTTTHIINWPAAKKPHEGMLVLNANDRARNAILLRFFPLPVAFLKIDNFENCWASSTSGL